MKSVDLKCFRTACGVWTARTVRENIIQTLYKVLQQSALRTRVASHQREHSSTRRMLNAKNAPRATFRMQKVHRMSVDGAQKDSSKDVTAKLAALSVRLDATQM
jgi:hypothetical protein